MRDEKFSLLTRRFSTSYAPTAREFLASEENFKLNPF